MTMTIGSRRAASVVRVKILLTTAASFFDIAIHQEL
jgi:hypothetical protein